MAPLRVTSMHCAPLPTISPVGVAAAQPGPGVRRQMAVPCAGIVADSVVEPRFRTATARSPNGVETPLPTALRLGTDVSDQAGE